MKNLEEQFTLRDKQAGECEDSRCGEHECGNLIATFDWLSEALEASKIYPEGSIFGENFVRGEKWWVQDFENVL